MRSTVSTAQEGSFHLSPSDVLVARPSYPSYPERSLATNSTFCAESALAQKVTQFPYFLCKAWKRRFSGFIHLLVHIHHGPSNNGSNAMERNGTVWDSITVGA